MKCPKKCPDCGSENIEIDDPVEGEHTCRDCGAWIDDIKLPKQTPAVEPKPISPRWTGHIEIEEPSK